VAFPCVPLASARTLAAAGFGQVGATSGRAGAHDSNNAFWWPALIGGPQARSSSSATRPAGRPLPDAETGRAYKPATFWLAKATSTYRGSMGAVRAPLPRKSP